MVVLYKVQLVIMLIINLEMGIFLFLAWTWTCTCGYVIVSPIFWAWAFETLVFLIFFLLHAAPSWSLSTNPKLVVSWSISLFEGGFIHPFSHDTTLSIYRDVIFFCGCPLNRTGNSRLGSRGQNVPNRLDVYEEYIHCPLPISYIYNLTRLLILPNHRPF